jgi:hypothetical protein
MSPRALVLDIETAPIEAYVWGLFDQNIALDQVKEDYSILCYCGWWLGEKKPITDHTGGRGAKKVRDDRKLMQGLWDLLDEADIVIAQNGQQFDIKRINARLIIHGFKPYSPIKIVDTLLSAKKHFGFQSNKLAYLSKVLANTKKSEHKKFPGFSLWTACLADDPAAWREMIAYNVIDVKSTAEVYERMLPWISSHPNLGAYVQDKDPRCPKCESKKLQRRGYSVTQQGSYERWHCQSCGGWARGKTSAMDSKVRRGLLANVA